MPSTFSYRSANCEAMRGLISMTAMRSSRASYIISILNMKLSKPSPLISRPAMSAMRSCTPSGSAEG